MHYLRSNPGKLPQVQQIYQFQLKTAFNLVSISSTKVATFLRFEYGVNKEEKIVDVNVEERRP